MTPGTKPCQISWVSSVSRARVSLPSASNRHSSTASAPPAHSAKLVPATPSGPTRNRAPNGVGAPGHTGTAGGGGLGPGPHRHGGRGRLAPRAVHQRGGALLGGFRHRLLLGCAGHRSASHGSWSNAEKGARRPGRDTPSRRSPHCSAQRLPRTHVSPGRAAGRTLSGEGEERTHGRLPGACEAGARTGSYLRFPRVGPVVGFLVTHGQ